MRRLEFPSRSPSLRRHRSFAGISGALVLMLFASGAGGCGESTELPRVRVEQGELVRTLVESGDVSARHSVTVRAPLEWGGDLLIVEMVPEGTLVEAGDFLLRFDAGFLEKELSDAEAHFEAKRAERRAALAEQESRRLQQENAVTTAKLSRNLAELQIEELKYESENRRADAELRLKKALVSLEEAETKLRAQAVLDSLQLAKIDVEMANLETLHATMKSRIAALTLTAPEPGLVLHADARREGQTVKVRVGDKIRPRGQVMEIPDPSSMQVRFLVHEIDRHRVEIGMPVRMVLEAAPEREFSGEITGIARLATPRVEEGRVRGFEVFAQLEGRDPLLRPGMSARVEVELERLEDRILVPLAAVFERDARTVVFPSDRWPEALELEPGPMNPFHMALTEAGSPLRPGTRLVTAVPDASIDPWGEARHLGEETP